MSTRLVKKNNNEILEQLQDDLQGEFDAIELYNKHINSIEVPEIKNKLIEIRDEEKHHATELEELIKKYKEN